MTENLFTACLSQATRSACHLETRDAYAISDAEADSYRRFLAGGSPDADPDGAYWRPWASLVGAAAHRGVRFRRARIVSEPTTDYVRWEHAITAANVAIGEDVRWLPRRSAIGLLVPTNDFWIFDDATVLFNHFSGDGTWLGTSKEPVTDPDIVKACAEAFEAAWSRAIAHEKYVPA